MFSSFIQWLKITFLVEKIVREDAEVVGSVNATSSGTNTDIAGDL